MVQYTTIYISRPDNWITTYVSYYNSYLWPRTCQIACIFRDEKRPQKGQRNLRLR